MFCLTNFKLLSSFKKSFLLVYSLIKRRELVIHETTNESNSNVQNTQPQSTAVNVS